MTEVEVVEALYAAMAARDFDRCSRWWIRAS